VSLLPGFAGEVIRPGDAQYDAARAVWNGMIDRRPALVVRPTGTGDVIAALRFARDRELVVAVRCGGHSIPGLSTCDDGIVIDLSRMRGVHVDPERRVARAAGGALLDELDTAAQEHNLVCPVGVVSHTGVAGLTLGGGMGRLQRRFGLTIDNLDAVELVTADGRLVRASKDENEDLFWGVRGAGANFGITTAFELRLHPLDRIVTHGTVVHPIDRAEELAAHVREATENGPEELMLAFGLGRDDAGRPIASVTALHCGRLDDAERDLAALRAFGPPARDTIEARPYLVVQHLADEAEAWGHRFYMKSNFVSVLADELVRSCAAHVGRAPDGGKTGFSFWACGGAIARVAEDATAFSGRDGAYWLACEAQWDDAALDADLRAWVRAAMDDVTPYASAGRYVNDVAETGGDVVRSVYGDAKYERLVALKRRWDSDNVFRLNQNIEP
jgi:FAD/FMN-containing dehydrogenase